MGYTNNALLKYALNNYLKDKVEIIAFNRELFKADKNLKLARYLSMVKKIRCKKNG